jgi:hypothetical protein
MSMSTLLAKMMDRGLKDTTAKGFLEYAIKTGNQDLIEGAKELVGMEEEFDMKKAKFLRSRFGNKFIPKCFDFK